MPIGAISANFVPLATLSFEAEMDGTLQIFLANESDIPVWFDDLQITWQRALVTQENHYYPFGLNLAGIEKEGMPDNQFQFGGVEKQSDFGLKWLHYKYRFYDPQVSRFFSPDPIAEDYYDLTTYQHASNNPASKIEIEGLEGIQAVKWAAYLLGLDAQNRINYSLSGKVKTVSGTAGAQGEFLGLKAGAILSHKQTTIVGGEGDLSSKGSSVKAEFNQIDVHDDSITKITELSGGALGGVKVSLEQEISKDGTVEEIIKQEANLGLFSVERESNQNTGEVNVNIAVSIGLKFGIGFIGIESELKGQIQLQVQPPKDVKE